ncbi:MAG: NAD(P)H-dependent glycerol-3-phosphate dehydrogenase [Arenicellales bacterium]|nr:NAD(P)H-dependent glycerol-3-phosphate dehydrogenase [Arenicellales bacterium]
MNSPSQAPVAVLGAGSWGTALALLSARCGRRVLLWSPEQDQVSEMVATASNERYLPGIPFGPNITATADLAAVTEATRDLVVAVPSHAFRPVLGALAGCRSGDSGDLRICWGAKGFEPASGLLLSEVFAEVLGESATPVVVSGPSFAGEVAQGLPTALTVAAATESQAETVAGWFRDERTRVYTSTDMRGVQLGGAIKNVMAIAAGISDGLGFGANARAALITRGLAEMIRLGKALGGQADTFMGLTGIGDLILTCTDDQSRNRRVGLGVARGHNLGQVLDQIGQEAEGVNTTRVLHRKSQEMAVEMPIAEQVYQVLFEGLDPSRAVSTLLSRDPRPESY